MALKKSATEAAAKSPAKRFREHVEEAKRPETRQRRIEKSVSLLAACRKEPR